MNKKDIGNFGSLIAIQASNAALPLFIFPYILKMVGAEYYSKIVTAEAVSVIVLSIILYSFEIEGVAKVVNYRVNNEFDKIKLIYSQILIIRVILFGVSSLLLLCMMPLIEHDTFILLSGWMLLPLGYIFQSTWLYQGLERNFPVAVCTVLSRTSAIALVLIFVRTPSDYFLVPTIIGGAYFAGGVISMAYLFVGMRIRFCRVERDDLRGLMLDGKEIFFGNIAVILYRDINVLILGAFGAKETVIATYSIAEKLIKSIQAAARPLSQMYFPKALESLRHENKAGIKALGKLIKFTYPQLVALLIILGLLMASYGVLNGRLDMLTNYTHKNEIISMMVIMYIAILFGVTNFMLGSVGLNWLAGKVNYFRYILITGFANLLICPLLFQIFGGIGAAMAFTLSEGLLLTLVLNKYLHD